MTDELTDETERALRALLTERAGVPNGDPHPVATLTRRHGRRRAVRVAATMSATAVAVVAFVLTPRILTGTDAVSRVDPAARSRAAAALPTVAAGETDPAALYLESSQEFRAAKISDDPAAVVRCAVERRSVRNQRLPHLYAWAMCEVVSGRVGTAVSLPVRLTYDESLGQFTSVLAPGDGAAYSAAIEEHFPGDTADRPTDQALQRLQAEIDRRRPPRGDVATCPDAAAARVVDVYVAALERLLADDLDREIKQVYVVTEYKPGPGGDVPAGVSGDTGPMPAAVRDCLADNTVHGLPMIPVTGEDDATIAREKPDGFSPVVQGVVVSLSAVGPGNAVVVAASAGYGGGLDFHGGVYTVSRAGDGWTAVPTGATWIA